MTKATRTLQKVLAKRRGQRKYWKYQIIIPKEKVRNLGWRKGLQLFQEIRGNCLVMVPMEPEEDPREMS